MKTSLEGFSSTVTALKDRMSDLEHELQRTSRQQKIE